MDCIYTHGLHLHTWIAFTQHMECIHTLNVFTHMECNHTTHGIHSHTWNAFTHMEYIHTSNAFSHMECIYTHAQRYTNNKWHFIQQNMGQTAQNMGQTAQYETEMKD